MAKRGASKQKSFEQITTRLSEIQQALEAGELSLEDTLKRFEEGVSLVREGTRKLDEAEERVEFLLSSNPDQQDEEIE